ncbi:LysR substrate-binding domain-containing protein [Actinokineospora auranticolor]|uniref:LysR substrate binding domain-containing protein n=1 Tax=Actinokineospora auranticolor TaxID=155976 RepID=A0A2S6GK21_9PSEU|nr:LysR substrate-binding domain-containing protein [Actinokineospora auranticolor]PPK65555.1 LysR substrate binding domain-containing protein [Actinokineospora auranticolor]
MEVRELVHHPLILMDRTFSARTAFDKAVARAGARVTDPIVLRSTVLAQAHAVSGRGAAVLTDTPIAGLHAAKVTVDGAQVPLTLYGAWERTHFAGDAIEEWVDRFATWLSHLPAVEELRNSTRA